MRSATHRFFGFVVAALLAVAAEPMAQACATCFGESDSPLAEGMAWGILSLIVVAYLVLFGIIGFFIFLARRSRMEEESALSSHAVYNDYNDTERTEEEQTELCSKSS